VVARLPFPFRCSGFGARSGTTLCGIGITSFVLHPDCAARL
jgi:hypothetical protein